jgi:hypothetical protein
MQDSWYKFDVSTFRRSYDSAHCRPPYSHMSPKEVNKTNNVAHAEIGSGVDAEFTLDFEPLACISKEYVLQLSPSIVSSITHNLISLGSLSRTTASLVPNRRSTEGPVQYTEKVTVKSLNILLTAYHPCCGFLGDEIRKSQSDSGVAQPPQC